MLICLLYPVVNAQPNEEIAREVLFQGPFTVAVGESLSIFIPKLDPFITAWNFSDTSDRIILVDPAYDCPPFRPTVPASLFLPRTFEEMMEMECTSVAHGGSGIMCGRVDGASYVFGESGRVKMCWCPYNDLRPMCSMVNSMPLVRAIPSYSRISCEVGSPCLISVEGTSLPFDSSVILKVATNLQTDSSTPCASVPNLRYAWVGSNTTLLLQSGDITIDYNQTDAACPRMTDSDLISIVEASTGCGAAASHTSHPSVIYPGRDTGLPWKRRPSSEGLQSLYDGLEWSDYGAGSYVVCLCRRAVRGVCDANDGTHFDSLMAHLFVGGPKAGNSVRCGSQAGLDRCFIAIEGDDIRHSKGGMIKAYQNDTVCAAPHTHTPAVGIRSAALLRHERPGNATAVPMVAPAGVYGFDARLENKKPEPGSYRLCWCPPTELSLSESDYLFDVGELTLGGVYADLSFFCHRENSDCVFLLRGEELLDSSRVQVVPETSRCGSVDPSTWPPQISDHFPVYASPIIHSNDSDYQVFSFSAIDTYKTFGGPCWQLDETTCIFGNYVYMGGACSWCTNIYYQGRLVDLCSWSCFDCPGGGCSGEELIFRDLCPLDGDCGGENKGGDFRFKVCYCQSTFYSCNGTAHFDQDAGTIHVAGPEGKYIREQPTYICNWGYSCEVEVAGFNLQKTEAQIITLVPSVVDATGEFPPSVARFDCSVPFIDSDHDVFPRDNPVVATSSNQTHATFSFNPPLQASVLGVCYTYNNTVIPARLPNGSADHDALRHLDETRLTIGNFKTHIELGRLICRGPFHWQVHACRGGEPCRIQVTGYSMRRTDHVRLCAHGQVCGICDPPALDDFDNPPEGSRLAIPAKLFDSSDLIYDWYNNTYQLGRAKTPGDFTICYCPQPPRQNYLVEEPGRGCEKARDFQQIGGTVVVGGPVGGEFFVCVRQRECHMAVKGYAMGNIDTIQLILHMPVGTI
ncbi:unnamed protein product [Vitrella brassicaformis CCMP3155]|uniref:Uncharacterized protein n=1 Tax=Vitrella brassicaformis (strain CCMP3155) TaxID=1169540 RepID=A0A0G4E8N7_VITBC|nr:unnamed protein product [Vitrella brassicaformis CCMP3155]|eukprot:CEL91727.1 unnamed protein product [Vitrella brassicaformis CCMP3155]